MEVFPKCNNIIKLLFKMVQTTPTWSIIITKQLKTKNPIVYALWAISSKMHNNSQEGEI